MRPTPRSEEPSGPKFFKRFKESPDNVERMDDRSFRGSVSGLGFFYCDFTRRMSVARVNPRRHSPPPVAPEATVDPTATAAAE